MRRQRVWMPLSQCRARKQMSGTWVPVARNHLSRGTATVSDWGHIVLIISSRVGANWAAVGLAHEVTSD